MVKELKRCVEKITIENKERLIQKVQTEPISQTRQNRNTNLRQEREVVRKDKR